MIDREHALRATWERMRTNTLPTDESLAEEQVLKAFRKWERDSRVTITSISPQSKHDSDEYTTIQCRIEASGNIDSMNHFLYDLEKDPMALKLELVELSAHDTEGQHLLLGLLDGDDTGACSVLRRMQRSPEAVRDALLAEIDGGSGRAAG